MRRLFLSLFALMGLAATVHGQEFRKTFSLEIGAGMGPAHMYLMNNPTWETEKALAALGQEARDGSYPALTVSGALRTWDRWETVATVGVSWGHFQITQYDTFGIDPEGKPRYDLKKGSPAGSMDLDPLWTLTIQERVYWNPRWKVQPYTGWGLGIVFSSEIFPLPSVTPVGVRLGGRHVYGFVETPISTYGLLFHGGLGWKF